MNYDVSLDLLKSDTKTIIDQSISTFYQRPNLQIYLSLFSFIPSVHNASIRLIPFIINLLYFDCVHVAERRESLIYLIGMIREEFLEVCSSDRKEEKINCQLKRVDCKYFRRRLE